MRNLSKPVLWAVAIALNFGAIAPNLSPNTPNTPTKTEEYIARFKDLAMFEQLTTNIPASIKLGQALLESEAGASELATNANNHFGLKCRTCSESEAYLKLDDERNKKGELILSKFHRFETAEASFAAHSHRLTTEPRYWSLFNYDRMNYQAWAYGLKACGYATDRYYAEKLITIIEKYDLHRFDKPSELIPSEFSEQDRTPQYAADLTSVNVPYNSDPNLGRPDYQLENAHLEAQREARERQKEAEKRQIDIEKRDKNLEKREKCRKVKMPSDEKKVIHNYRTDSEFISPEGEQMHYTLYEVTLEGDTQNVLSKSAPKKKTTTISKPVQRKKNVRAPK